MFRFLIVIALLAPLLAQAQVYRTTDKDGNVVFTDTPPADGGPTERVEIRQPNTTPAPQVLPTPSAQPGTKSTEPEALPQEVVIVSPADETSFPMGPGNFDVDAKVTPALGESESLQLYIDGIPWSGPQREQHWVLTNIFRGAHDLTVSVLGSEGQAQTTSKPVRVFVHRPSVNFRNRN